MNQQEQNKDKIKNNQPGISSGAQKGEPSKEAGAVNAKHGSYDKKKDDDIDKTDESGMATS